MAAERYYPTILELPENDRPRERLLQYGVGVVSNAELLAIILRTGTRDENAVMVAQGLLRKYGTLAAIAQASTEELAGARGVGPAKVAQLKAALELGRRMLAETPDMKPQIRSPADAANLVMSEMCWLEQEHLRTILLDTKNRVVAKPTVYQGSLNTSLIRVGELFREAIRANCAAMIVVHNHPSGDPTPSPEDVAVTRQIAEVLDHLIIGRQRFVSLKERGLGFG
jgi:DNA repair protein RadC